MCACGARTHDRCRLLVGKACNAFALQRGDTIRIGIDDDADKNERKKKPRRFATTAESETETGVVHVNADSTRDGR
jgi:hypothetical protein